MKYQQLFLIGLAALYLCFPAMAQDGKIYKTPEDAVESFASAVAANDDARMKVIFGAEVMDLFSGTKLQRLETYRLLTLLTEERWALASTEDGSRIVRLGLEGWPLPVPLVKTDDGWQFNASEGIDELLNRAIGRNELMTIETCEQIFVAQKEFFNLDTDGDGVKVYASRFRSSPGHKDGLFWKVELGEPLSPLQKALADSWRFAQGHVKGAPWWGYQYRAFDRQGSSAEGGAFTYLVDGKQTKGYALVAYPANYGRTGVMTFLMNQDGKVFQKDLGEDTVKAVFSMEGFDPGEGWTEVLPTP
jgi:Protein of unknown function (DUF2950)